MAGLLMLAPMGAAEQQGKMFQIGILSPAARPDTKIFDAFGEGLRELGYIDGQNIRIEYRLAAGDVSRLPRVRCRLCAGGGSLVRTRLGILRVYKKGAKPFKRGRTIIFT